MVATAMQMLAGGALLTVARVATGELGRFNLAAVSGASVAAMTYLVLIGSLVGFNTYVWLLRVAPLPRISTYAYVNPVVAVFLGALILGEPITIRTLVASGIIVVAVALIVTARARRATAVARSETPDPALPATRPEPASAVARPERPTPRARLVGK